MSAAPDVTIVGAGLIGAATALGLAEAGLSVALYDTEFPGSGSSGAAMGHLVTMDDSPAQLALTAHSCARWRVLGRTLPDDCEIDYCGTLWLATDPGELLGVRERIAAYATHGVRSEMMAEHQLREHEPNLCRGLAGAFHVPDDGVCYPPAVARALANRAAEKGAILHFGDQVTAIAAHEVCLSNGTRHPTGAIVVAAGVHSPELVAGLPVVPRKGHLVITDRQPGLVRSQLVELGYLQSAHTFGNASVAFNIQPRRTGQLLIGSSRELVGFDGSINRALLRAMLERAARFVPGVNSARVLRTWTGFRPATADKLPLIGRWPALPDLWIAAGHEGLGITMAPGTADLIVAGITGRAAPVDPTPFAPDRPMPTMTMAAA
jgi:glycine/D-amino acid oxidase-like deaminating enzyme